MKRFLALCAVLALLLSALAPAALASVDMYVYTPNGKSLNVRSDPQTGANSIGSLPYGSLVKVDYYIGNGWTVIFWGSGSAFVQSKYLVSTQPGPAPAPSPSGSGSSKSSSSSVGSGLNAINAEFKLYQPVTPYSVLTTHTRSSGVINMRFAPHQKAQLIRSYPVGKRLIVVAHLKDWYEVEDPESGRYGYIRKDFLRQN